jgi:ABC-type uncharacterized transport system substrate-binding protein
MNRRELIALLGGAVGLPRVVRAEQIVPVIGFLHQGSPEPLSLMNAFRKGLSEVGIIEGQNVTIEDRAADGHYDRLPALATELVERRVAVIAANFLPAALAAKTATQKIPIIFLSGSDPIGAGLVSSINRPTGNVTNLPDAFSQTGVYVGRILKGARPADLPVLQPTKIEFVLNLKTEGVGPHCPG